MVQLQFLRHHVLGLWQFVHCFSPLLEFFLRQSFSLGNDPNGNVTLPVPNMMAGAQASITPAGAPAILLQFPVVPGLPVSLLRAKSDGISRPNGLSALLFSPSRSDFLSLLYQLRRNNDVRVRRDGDYILAGNSNLGKKENSKLD